MRLLEKTQMDNLSSMTKAHDEGREEGLVEGEHNAKIATARNLTSMGLSLEQISKATGLSVDEIKTLV